MIMAPTGKRTDKNSLNITVEGVKAMILLSSKNQSKERNDSEVVPAFSTGPKTAYIIEG